MEASGIRDRVLDAIDSGLLTSDFVALACLQYMSVDEVLDMLRANDIDLDVYDEND